MPDLTPAILAAIGDDAAAPGDDTQLALRWILAILALVQIGVAVPALLLGSDAGLPVHTARHLGSFDIAVAVGFLFAAWRPARIPGLLPVVAALVACLVGVVDARRDRRQHRRARAKRTTPPTSPGSRCSGC